MRTLTPVPPLRTSELRAIPNPGRYDAEHKSTKSRRQISWKYGHGDYNEISSPGEDQDYSGVLYIQGRLHLYLGLAPRKSPPALEHNMALVISQPSDLGIE